MKRRTFMVTAGMYAAGAAGLAAMEAMKEPDPMKVLLWCWDGRMTWDDEPDRIQTKMAAAEQRFPYSKHPESYQQGFRRLVDYCAAQGIWGIVIWGFLRDGHGGVKAARDLCLYARDKGVAILPGVGLCAYGGYYYEGDHPFNLDTYLQKHPDRVSVAGEENGGRTVSRVLDPSLPENRQWWQDGLDWMLDTFEISGINYEMGDFMVNPSAGAQAARDALNLDTDENIQDIVVAGKTLTDHAYALRPDGVFIHALYRGYHRVRNLQGLSYVKAMHPKTVWQYTLTEMVREKAFPNGYAGLASHRQYGYLHWFNASTGTGDRDYVPEIARAYAGAHQLGFEFVGTYGELRGNSITADRNYRAQVAWAANPNLGLDDFE